MLKPLIKIIKACIACFVVCVIISIVFDFVEFPHSKLIQQFALGAACSFIVVIVSTWAQYKVEFKKAFSNYISVTSHLIFTIVNCQDIIPSIKIMESYFNKLNSRFEEFQKANSEVLCFTKKKEQEHLKNNKIIKDLLIAFLKGKIDSHEKAVLAIQKKDSIIDAINIYLEYWPDCFEKENIKMYKSWLQEENEE